MKVQTVENLDAFLKELVANGGKVAEFATYRDEPMPVYQADGEVITENVQVYEYHVVDGDGYLGMVTHVVGEGWEEVEFAKFDTADY